MTVESTTSRNVPGPAHTSPADTPEVARLPLPQSVERAPAPVPLPTWTYRVFTIGGEVYESKVLTYQANGVKVVLGRRSEVFIPYFGMDRIESYR